MSDLRLYGSAACVVATLVATADVAQAGGGTTAAAPVAVRGIDGIKGAKLVNLEKALQLQHSPPPPTPKASVAKLVKGPPGPPTKDPPPPTDDRNLLEEIPPDQLGGS